MAESAEPSESLEALEPPIGRLAPSPTGRLHLGHARSFLLAWWSVRSRGGRLRLRMEDLDPERVKPGDAAGVLRDLEWLGLDWDGQPLWQSRRGEAYRAALEALDEAGWLYPCVCTRKEIASAAGAPHDAPRGAGGAANSAGTPTAPEAASGDRYPGTCEGRFASRDEALERSGRPAAWRFRANRCPGPIEFEDALHGRLAFDVATEVGDFPLTRKDGIAAYQLAVVVDDAAQGVTEVLRGDDLLSSTSRQVLLLEALGLTRPRYAHVPLVTDEAGERLAKRCDSLSLAELREAGVDPRAIVAWAARTSGLECGERARAEELLAGFDLARLPRGSVAVRREDFVGG